MSNRVVYIIRNYYLTQHNYTTVIANVIINIFYYNVSNMLFNAT